MNALRCCIGVALVLCMSATAFGLGEYEERLAEGKKLLKDLKPLRPGTIKQHYFEVKGGPNATAYAVVTLEAKKKDGRIVYAYRNESTVRTVDGMNLVGVIEAKLRPNFEPLEIRATRKVTMPGKPVQEGWQKAVIGPKEIVLTVFNGQVETSQTVPRPKADIVFALDALVQYIDLAKYKSFALHELNPPGGAARHLVFQSERQPDGTWVLTARKEDGAPAHTFSFDKSGNLHKWREGSAPVEIQRATKERIDELKAMAPGGSGQDSSPAGG